MNFEKKKFAKFCEKAPLVLNKMLHLRYLAGFLICFDFRIYQSSEYTKGSGCVRATEGFK